MLKLIFSTFLLVFIAELGDKTQLATMLLSAKSNSVLPIFIGASLALVLSTLIGVTAGAYITKIVPPSYIHNTAGILFLFMGILILSGKI